MKKFIIQAIGLVLIISAGLYFFRSGSGSVEFPFVPKSPKLTTLQINNSALKVEVADTAKKRSKGLGGRENIASDEGMLFVFDKADRYPFWMKGLKFPLDFVWIKDNTVVDFLENVPPPAANQKESALPIYSAKVEINKVLEINAGLVQRLNIKIGDTIKLSP